MNTQQANANRNTGGFKPGRLLGFLSSILPTPSTVHRSPFDYAQGGLFTFFLLAAGMLAGTAFAWSPVLLATGGDTNYVWFAGPTEAYGVHVFTTVGSGGTFAPLSGSLNVEYLVVAGGGGGGTWQGGGGGAGGVLTNSPSSPLTISSSQTITNGYGGAGGVPNNRGSQGGPSSIGALVVATGGGGGGSPSGNGLPGGSGGGGAGHDNGPAGGTATPVPKQGYNGGTGSGASRIGAGGGGGAATNGYNQSVSNTGGNGGEGVTNSITGTAKPYGGGGGGYGSTAGGQGGSGIGGKGGATAGNGLNGTGSGGGGNNGTGGAGGSGIVVIRYQIPYSSAPVIINKPVTDVKTNSATFNGLLVDTNTSATTVAVLWGPQNGGSTWSGWANTNWFDGNGWTNNASLSTNITGLTPDITYYYTYAATNGSSNAVALGVKTFITGAVTVNATDPNAQYKAPPIDQGEYTIYRPVTATNEAVTVNYALSGSMTNGVHYTLSGSATIGAGATSTVFTLTPTYAGSGGNAVLTLPTLATNTYPVGVSPNDQATVTISAPDLPAAFLVVTNGTPGVTPTVPYGTWATAAMDIQTAVDFAGAVSATHPTLNTVIVSNGTYNIGAQILITNAITVRSFGNGADGGLANASNTVVQGPGGGGDYGPRIFSITKADAVLDGFTIRNGSGRGDNSANRYLGGYRNWDGLGVYMDNGTVRNCIIKENGISGDRSHLQGSGIFMTGGTVSNCTIQANLTGGGTSDGGGIYATGGQILFCRILGNTMGGGTGGGGIYASSASVLIRNCLIVSNSASGSGGGVYGGTIESCTIVTNSATATGGGIYLGGTVSNSIVYFNTVGGVHSNLNTTAGLGYSCSINPGTTANGNTNVDPNISFTDYRLNADSPCIDKGSNQAWMDVAKDLAGNDRKIFAGKGGSVGAPVVDMGAYENIPTPLITVSDSLVTLAFGNVMTNTVSAETNYTVSGSFLTTSVTVTSPPNFEISLSGGGAGFGSSVALTPVNGTLSATTIYVRFLPMAVQVYSTNIAHTSSGATTVTKAVSGSGVKAGAPTVAAVPGSLVFGNVITNKTSVEQTYQVSGSNLTDNVTVGASAGFWIYTNGGSLVQSLTLTTNLPGKLDAVTVYVRFVPTAPISYNTSISNSSPDAVDSLVTVSGAGVVQGITVSGGPLNFGNVVIHRTNTLSFTVSGSNLEDNVIVTAPSPEFTVSTSSNSGFAASLPLAPVGGAPTGGVLAATNVYVRFIPTSIQAYGGNITNSSTGANSQFVSCIATGIDIPGPYAYVVTNGTPGVVPQEPYNTWGRAATEIQTAVNYAGANLGEVSTVIVSNGTYSISAQITISAGITVRSFGNGVYGGLANASNTIVQGPGGANDGPRIFSIINAGAVLDGFTIRNGCGRGDVSVNRYLGGSQNWDGHGVYMMNGLVQNCIIKENGLPPSNNSHLEGGGVFMDGGTVSNCTIQANLTGGGTSDGGGIYATGGQILFCRILGNTSSSSTGVGGGGIYASSAVLIRNCLIATNSCSTLSGGGVYGGTIESCTIVSNSAVTTGGGVYLAGGTVSNSIVYFNTVGGVHSNLNTTAGLGYSCSVNPGTTANGNRTDDPQFSSGNYTLLASSPCIDKGANQAWMDGALDLAGNTRKTYGGLGGTRSSPAVDMGAYEAPELPPRGTMFLLR